MTACWRGHARVPGAIRCMAVHLAACRATRGGRSPVRHIRADSAAPDSSAAARTRSACVRLLADRTPTHARARARALRRAGSPRRLTALESAGSGSRPGHDGSTRSPTSSTRRRSRRLELPPSARASTWRSLRPTSHRRPRRAWHRTRRGPPRAHERPHIAAAPRGPADSTRAGTTLLHYERALELTADRPATASILRGSDLPERPGVGLGWRLPARRRAMRRAIAARATREGSRRPGARERRVTGSCSGRCTRSSVGIQSAGGDPEEAMGSLDRALAESCHRVRAWNARVPRRRSRSCGCSKATLPAARQSPCRSRRRSRRRGATRPTGARRMPAASSRDPRACDLHARRRFRVSRAPRAKALPSSRMRRRWPARPVGSTTSCARPRTGRCCWTWMLGARRRSRSSRRACRMPPPAGWPRPMAPCSVATRPTSSSSSGAGARPRPRVGRRSNGAHDGTRPPGTSLCSSSASCSPSLGRTRRPSRLVGQTLLQLETVPAGQWSGLVLRSAISLAIWQGDPDAALAIAQEDWPRVLETDEVALIAAAASACLEAAAAAAERGRESNDTGLVSRARELADLVIPDVEARVADWRVDATVGARRDADLRLATAKAHRARVRGRPSVEAWHRLANAWQEHGAPFLEAKARLWQTLAILATTSDLDRETVRATARDPLAEAYRIALELPARAAAPGHRGPLEAGWNPAAGQGPRDGPHPRRPRARRRRPGQLPTPCRTPNRWPRPGRPSDRGLLGTGAARRCLSTMDKGTWSMGLGRWLVRRQCSRAGRACGDRPDRALDPRARHRVARPGPSAIHTA